ncbi:hypothetical protein DPMN_007926 [Dreissena polymorpha]|uniref:guanylate cyclase n=1 Tax=Dreissena polymorpha TaxID=45954 RepID=A0A9D4MWR0_DREPO|nr:hypothetical protein DPMN_007926 [Dreissena polymorpha]
MEKIEEWKQRSDSLLYSMIPQSVAGMLKAGADPISTCEVMWYPMRSREVSNALLIGLSYDKEKLPQLSVFDNVTIMFSYMVGFGEVCSQATPMEIVKIINRVYILFDRIIDKYKVFKYNVFMYNVFMYKVLKVYLTESLTGTTCSRYNMFKYNVFKHVFKYNVVKYNVFMDTTDIMNCVHCQVETLGDAVYMVAGGVPDRSPHHAINVAALSMELKHEAENLNEPWQQQYQLNSRIGRQIVAMQCIVPAQLTNR